MTMMLTILKKKGNKHKGIMVSSKNRDRRAGNLTSVWMIEEGNNLLQIKLAGIANNQCSK